MLTVEQLAKEIKAAVEWLVENECGCSTIKLDERLAVCVGWSDGYDVDDDGVIHSKTEPTWCVNAGIKVWTSDSLRTDFDWINAPYHEESGEVWDTDCSIAPNENYQWLAKWFWSEYEAMSKWEIENGGKIVGHKNLWVCEHCLQAIECHEGAQATLKHSVGEEDKIESTCDWCHENGFNTLYEIL